MYQSYPLTPLLSLLLTSSCTSLYRPLPPDRPHLGHVREDGGAYPLPRVEPGVQPEHLLVPTLILTELQQQDRPLLVRLAQYLQLDGEGQTVDFTGQTYPHRRGEV